MPTYDPASSPLLSQAAQRLGPQELAAQADAAEAVLDAELAGRGRGTLTEKSFTTGTTEHDRAVMAVAYQVNHQVEAGVAAEVYEQQSRGDRSGTYRGRTVSALALEIASTVVDAPSSSSWPIAGGLR